VNLDFEVASLERAHSALAPLDPKARARALTWLNEFFADQERKAIKVAVAIAAFARAARRLNNRKRAAKRVGGNA
jgi:hypothetical protein